MKRTDVIEIVPYQPTWPEEFLAIAQILREALGSPGAAHRPYRVDFRAGLAAKDRIDIQVTVESLDPLVEQAFNRVGYQRSIRYTRDHIPPAALTQAEDWVKWFFNAPEQQRPTNVHVRISGLPNQRYPLLFRDFLRADPAAALAYAQIKLALAKYHADDADAYYEIKNPVCDIIMAGAELWAAKIDWMLGSSDS